MADRTLQQERNRTLDELINATIVEMSYRPDNELNRARTEAFYEGVEMFRNVARAMKTPEPGL